MRENILDTDSQSNLPSDSQSDCPPGLQPGLQTGDRVRLSNIPPYFKTAEPIPMLRPPNVVQLGEEGIILGRDLGDMWRVRFMKGAYLLDQQYLERLESPAT